MTATGKPSAPQAHQSPIRSDNRADTRPLALSAFNASGQVQGER